MKLRERFMLACAGILCAACVIVLIRYVTHQYFIRNLGLDNAWTQTVFFDNTDLQHWIPPRNIPLDEFPVDWAAKYPYQPTPPIEQKKERTIDRNIRKFHEQTNVFEKWTNERFLAYRRITEIMHAFLNVTNWNIPLIGSGSNDVQYKRGHFASLMAKRNESRQIEVTADLAAFCKKHDINFVVLLAPWKFPRSSSYNGTLDFANENSDAYLSGLRNRGVDIIDLRTDIDREGLPYDDLFIKSDHHWTLATARWATSILEKHLNDIYGYQADISLLDSSRFREECYPSWFRGSHGERLTSSIVAPDDFYLFYPRYTTSFHISIPSMKIDRQGDFSILYNMKELKPGSYSYHAYAYGDRALIQIQNKKKQDGKHLLLLHDSYGASAAPFLALGMERLDLLDTRYFTGSFRTYIEREHPDTVILCYGAIEFNLDDILNPPKKPFDFR